MADQEIQVADGKEAAPDKGELTHEGVYFTPAVDIYETEQELVVLVDMPGAGVDDVDIDLKDDTLSVIGKLADEVVDGQALLNEYRTGNYYRSFRLAEAVDQSQISASLADGVLKIVLPKAARAVPRRIPIQGE